MREPTVLLAALEDGTHVQVGRVRGLADAYTLFERMDRPVSGFYRDAWGKLRLDKPRKDHFIDGKAVRFYRLRQQGHEFGNVPSYPISAVRLTNRKASTSMTRTTPGGIARPKRGTYTTFARARKVAKERNRTGLGRGNRALKAQDGNYSVVFRPAVVNNKQRRVREVI